MKQKVSIALILLFILGSLTVNVSAMYFPDVDASVWYADAVGYISELGVMVGDNEGNFNPDQPVTRAEMATIICRTLEETQSGYDSIYMVTDIFSDVSETHWANIYINKVSVLGIAGGYGNGRFGPSDYLNYEQAVTMIVRMLGAESEALNRGGYPDGHLAVADSMGLLSNVRAVKGEGLSRANVAVLLFNYLHDGVIGDSEQGSPLGEDIESTPGQDGQHGDSLQIGDMQQEDQPGSAPDTDGVGGGT